MKKIIIFLIALVSMVGTAMGQSYVGSWELFPSYGAPSKLIETPGYVYALAGTSLCGYDKQTGEVASYNTGNRLNGNKVTNIWFDPDKKYIFVVYEDYNIDLVYDDGRVINVPDLRDAAITSVKTVNNVAFANGKAFAGLACGMLIIDADHGAVIESCLWEKNITHIAATDNKIVLWVGYNATNEMYMANQTGSHHNFSSAFVKVSGGFYPNTGLMRLSGDKLYAANTANAATFTFDGDEVTRKFVILNKTLAVNNVQPTRNGLLVSSGKTLFYVDKDGTVTEKTVAAAEGNKVADWSGDGAAVWLADASGYGKYDVGASAFAIAKAKPRGTSGTNVGRIIQTSDGNFYISTAELHQNDIVRVLSSGKIAAVDRYDVSTNTFYQLPASLFTTTLTGFNVDANNPDRIFTGYHAGGGRNINLLDNTTIIYSPSNTAFEVPGTYTSMLVDSNGNLWVCQKTGSIVNIGKALKGNWETQSNPSGWSFVTVPLLENNHSTRMILDEAHGVAIVTGKNGIAAVRMPDADKPLTSSLRTAYTDCETDADGASFGGWKYPALAIDKNGWVWIGNNNGVMVIKDSNRMFDTGFAPMRPKVARNDGTNLADYLLNQVEVFCIAVDENNQKWIGTIGSGLYRVNDDGSEIIEHFTTENSDLPSNDVLTVCPDRNNNDIYIGTADGLSIYHSTTSPGAEDYKDAYAYPNPVLPDYTGYITITGLKANSLVKITDAAGNTFFETRSDGGLAVWNGCDAKGRRVRSGVYFVFASEAGEGATGAAVTKIVVVN